jgi:hypothetical protein
LVFRAFVTSWAFEPLRPVGLSNAPAATCWTFDLRPPGSDG